MSKLILTSRADSKFAYEAHTLAHIFFLSATACENMFIIQLMYFKVYGNIPLNLDHEFKQVLQNVSATTKS